MYRNLLTILILAILLTISFAQWETLNQAGNFRTIDFVNSETGWLSGQGTLMKTVDGGDSWVYFLGSEIWSSPLIDFIDESTGWASRHESDPAGSVIMKTSDGGQTWIDQENLPGYSIRGINAVDFATVYILSDTVLLKTTDGGSTWQEISVGNENIWFTAICFVTSDQGMIAGLDTMNYEPTIWKTYDGGDHWQKKAFNEFSNISSLHFIDNFTGYLVANTDSGMNVICQTQDFGEIWSMKLQSQYGISSLCYMNIDTVYCIVSDSTGKKNILKSVDGGDNWEKQFYPDPEAVRFPPQMKYISSRVGFIISQNLILFRTTDAGTNWKINALAYPLKDVFFIGKYKGYVCGSFRSFHFGRDDLFITDDGGKTWADINIKSPDGFRTVLFVDELVGYLLSSSQVYKSTDGGNNWTEYIISNYDSTGVYFWGENLCFTNQINGWVVGSYSEPNGNGAAIYRTWNAGVKWDSSLKYPSTDPLIVYNLNSVFFLNDTFGWAVGESGLIFRYNYIMDEWELIKSLTDLPLIKVLFTDQYTGWIGGGYYTNEFHPVLLKSTDGGLTWVDQKFRYLVNDIYFSDPLHGWVVGSDSVNKGAILATRDGGNLWQVQANNLIAPLTAIHFSDGRGWAVGNKGLILKTDNGGSSWIDQDKNIYSTGYELDQNYPNPFNPSTNIQFSIPKSEFVTLEIYNLLGQKVSTLVSGKQPIGTYNVEWDARGFASGVYLYRLQAGNYSETKKLILLK